VQDFADSIAKALELIFGLDRELLSIVLLSIRVSATAAIIAFLIGVPLGAMLAAAKFRGSGALVVLANALLGLPPVVAGLIVYLALSRSGPLGNFGLLFTPAAMVIAQAMLGLPIVVALTHRAMEPLWKQFGDSLSVVGASRARAGLELIRMGRGALLTIFLAAFGRAIAEVGAILVVGGNIRGFTRTMTTTIALETSKGELGLALGLGVILVAISLVVSTLAFSLERWTRRV
jgi:tungstate transport system permease protein